MKVPLQRPGVILCALIALSPPLAVQAGMQLKPDAVPTLAPAPVTPAPAAPAAVTPMPEAPKARQAAKPASPAAPRRGDKTAWTPCIRLVNAAALGAAITDEQRQALIERCAP